MTQTRFLWKMLRDFSDSPERGETRIPLVRQDYNVLKMKDISGWARNVPLGKALGKMCFIKIKKKKKKSDRQTDKIRFIKSILNNLQLTMPRVAKKLPRNVTSHNNYK